MTASITIRMRPDIIAKVDDVADRCMLGRGKLIEIMLAQHLDDVDPDDFVRPPSSPWVPF